MIYFYQYLEQVLIQALSNVSIFRVQQLPFSAIALCRAQNQSNSPVFFNVFINVVLILFSCSVHEADYKTQLGVRVSLSIVFFVGGGVLSLSYRIIVRPFF